MAFCSAQDQQVLVNEYDCRRSVVDAYSGACDHASLAAFAVSFLTCGGYVVNDAGALTPAPLGLSAACAMADAGPPCPPP
jgi:hypothetical protein